MHSELKVRQGYLMSAEQVQKYGEGSATFRERNPRLDIAGSAVTGDGTVVFNMASIRPSARHDLIVSGDTNAAYWNGFLDAYRNACSLYLRGCKVLSAGLFMRTQREGTAGFKNAYFSQAVIEQEGIRTGDPALHGINEYRMGRLTRASEAEAKLLAVAMDDDRNPFWKGYVSMHNDITAAMMPCVCTAPPIEEKPTKTEGQLLAEFFGRSEHDGQPSVRAPRHRLVEPEIVPFHTIAKTMASDAYTERAAKDYLATKGEAYRRAGFQTEAPLVLRDDFDNLEDAI